MIEEYVTDIAAQMGIVLSKVTLTEGRSLGCLDSSILSMESGNKIVGEFVHQFDLQSLESGSGGEMLELKIRAALVRLRIMLET